MRFLSACAVFLALSAGVAKAANCQATVDDCDTHFTSMGTQTWVEQTIAPHTVQVVTYFGNYRACIEAAGSGVALSEQACARPASRFSIADNATASVIKSQEVGKCLAAKFSAAPMEAPTCSVCVSTCTSALGSVCGGGNATVCEKVCKDTVQCKADNGTAAVVKKYPVKFGECCRPHGCTAQQSTAQMWLQPPTPSNPYNIIKNQVNGGQYCLTRVNGTNDVELAPCDSLWASRSTQTFARVAAGPYVQLEAFWASEHACIGEGSDGKPTLSEEACKSSSSVFAFSETNDYGYFKSSASGKCLVGDFGFPDGVTCEQCAKVCKAGVAGSCGKGDDKCQSFCEGMGCLAAKPSVALTLEECDDGSDEQLWMQLGGQDPYKRLQVKHSDLKDASWCLSRTGDPENAPCQE